MKQDPLRLLPASYPGHIALPTRFGDMDPNRHLNNVAIAQLFEEARVQFNTASAAVLGVRPRFLVARVAIDYLAEGEYPGMVALHTGVAHIGNSSFTMAMAAFQQDRCFALCDSVLVYRGDDGGPAPLPPALRTRLEAHRLLG